MSIFSGHKKDGPKHQSKHWLRLVKN